ncbi:unnamed protein product [Natator depressus]
MGGWGWMPLPEPKPRGRSPLPCGQSPETGPEAPRSEPRDRTRSPTVRAQGRRLLHARVQRRRWGPGAMGGDGEPECKPKPQPQPHCPQGLRLLSGAGRGHGLAPPPSAREAAAAGEAPGGRPSLGCGVWETPGSRQPRLSRGALHAAPGCPSRRPLTQRQVENYRRQQRKARSRSIVDVVCPPAVTDPGRRAGQEEERL